jgi:predicted amidohydrolase
VVCEGVDVVVLPENFTSGFSMNLDSVDCWEDDLTSDWMKRLSSELDVALFGSVAFKMPDGTARNRGLFVNPSGEVEFYDKKHLFTLGGEDKHYVAGESRTVVEFRGWKILLQICYDLRFPVFSKNRYEDLYDAIIYVANWPRQRIHAWRTLLQARAVENQCYVIGVNRCGEDPSGNIYTGDSLGIDPLGAILSEGPVVDLLCERYWDGE